MSVTRELLGDICDDIQDAVKGVLKKHSVDLKGVSASSSGADLRLTVKGHFNTDEARVARENAAQRDFSRLARRNPGLEHFKIGETYLIAGKMYRLDGVKLSRRKYPLSVTKVKNGKTYKMSVDHLLNSVPIATK